MGRTKYSLLALDGGGIRGAMPARILQEIEARLGRPPRPRTHEAGAGPRRGVLGGGPARPLRRPRPGDLPAVVVAEGSLARWHGQRPLPGRADRGADEGPLRRHDAVAGADAGGDP